MARLRSLRRLIESARYSGITGLDTAISLVTRASTRPWRVEMGTCFAFDTTYAGSGTAREVGCGRCRFPLWSR